MHDRTQPLGSHAAILAASHAPTPSGLSLPSPSPTYESKCLEGTAQKLSEALRSVCWHAQSAINVWPARRQPRQGCQKTPFRHPSHTTEYCQFRHSRHNHLCTDKTDLLLLSDPQAQHWPSSAISRTKRGSSSRRSSPSKASASFSDSAYRAARHCARHKARTCSRLSCPTRVRRRTEPGWGQSESLCLLQGWLLIVVGWPLNIACMSLHHAAILLLCSTLSA